MTFRLSVAAIPATAFLIGTFLVPSALAQEAPARRTAGADWAEQMFDKTKLDFGVVARGAETKTLVAITNKYLEEVSISSVSATCGCTDPKIVGGKRTLKTYETAYVEVEMDTRRFTREKTSNVIVRFSRPAYAEVRIPVRMYVRTDVVLEPGGVNFGALGVG
ncbi:MAG: DUF1573 domain-containing protein, partial [Planctomycetota bacterium]